jgi:putative acyl-CoA dehydrogenase
VLLEALARNGAGWAEDGVVAFGKLVTSEQVYEWGFLSNRHGPTLQTHDRYGNRIDQVEFHPAWHNLLQLSVQHGLHSLPWEPEGAKAGHLVRAALAFLASQIEAGHFCPISMTYAVVPALRHQPELASAWEPTVFSRTYDPSFAPIGAKTGALFGMGMTEKQGGSDVRTNTTVAERFNDGYLVTGHKWFTSAPMNDAFLILAQASGGLTCFLLPRFRPDGNVNEIRIQRLKDKLGNRSNASAEVEFEGAFAARIGEEGRGVATIIEMVNGTRLDCVTGSAGLMRQAVTQAIHHCRYREAFGRRLIHQPAMRNVLADLEVETEAAVLLMTRLASAFDGAVDDQQDAAFRRIATPLAKYWVTKRCGEVVHEALECLGGNGFVEESIMPRLYREAPVNAIWEGSGNVIALDVMRAATNPETIEALADELSLGAGIDPRIDRAIATALALVRQPENPEARARLISERLAVALQASLLARYGRPPVTEAYVRTRLGGEGGLLYGTLPADVNLESILEPAVPIPA